MSKVKRYLPTIGEPNWNIKELNENEKAKLKSRLVIGKLENEEDYQSVIGYLYQKFPFEMDLTKLPNGNRNVPIQWNYSVAKNKALIDIGNGQKRDMYAFAIYDSERDMEPVAFAGSYFKLSKAYSEESSDPLMNKKYLCDENCNFDENGKYQIVGNGYVMFIDPSYRRLGLATDLWWAEAQLYRDYRIRYQREIQNEYSLISTQKMFSDPSKCIITSPGRLKQDGTRCQIRVLLDYEDDELVKGFDNMAPNLKEIYNEANWNFLKREAFNKEDLIKYWK